MSQVMLSSLLVRPPIRTDESGQGYKLRLAHSNGLSLPGWLNSCADLVIPPSSNREHVRWCPHCLSQNHPYWRALWGKSIPICTVHQCWLADTCEQCSRPLTWRSARLLSCSCGASLTNITAISVSTDLIALGTISQSPSLTWLAEFDVEQRWALARFLGALHIYGLQDKPLKKASTAAIQTTRNVMVAGATIVLGGEPAFHTLLSRARIAQQPCAGAQLFKEAFPALLSKIRRQLPPAQREVLVQWIRSFLHI